MPSPQPDQRELQERILRFPATTGLIAFTVLVYILQILLDQIFGQGFLLSYLAKLNEAFREGEVWRLISPLFVHAGMWHIFVNMYSLYALGPAIERFFGSARMFVIYILSGATGVVFSMSFSPRPSVGASGAIFGLLGSLGMFLFLHRNSFGRAGSLQLRQIILVALLNLGLGFAPQIDNWGHLGGLLAGVGLTWYLGPAFKVEVAPTQMPRLIDRRPWMEVRARALLAAAVIVIFSVAATASPFVP
jgi:rhomboid protease GluP